MAQFGRGVLAEVSAKLLGQFADALEADIAASGQAPESGARESRAPESGVPESEAPGDGSTGRSDASVVAPDNGAGPGAEARPASSSVGDGAASSGVRTISGPEAEPVDLFAVSKDSVVRRLLPLAPAAGSRDWSSCWPAGGPGPAGALSAADPPGGRSAVGAGDHRAPALGVPGGRAPRRQ